jgi:rRNA maturation RNase YbeY
MIKPSLLQPLTPDLPKPLAPAVPLLLELWTEPEVEAFAEWPALEALWQNVMPELATAFMQAVGLPCLQERLNLNPAVLETLLAEVILTDNAGIQALNNEHRGKNEATDVLSFPSKQVTEDLSDEENDEETEEQDDKKENLPALCFDEEETLLDMPTLPQHSLGSLVISVEWALQHCQTESVTVDNSAEKAAETTKACVLFLCERLLHGLLHLSGQHHGTMASYQKVIGLQAAMLQACPTLKPFLPLLPKQGTQPQ